MSKDTIERVTTLPLTGLSLLLALGYLVLAGLSAGEISDFQ